MRLLLRDLSWRRSPSMAGFITGSTKARPKWWRRWIAPATSWGSFPSVVLLEREQFQAPLLISLRGSLAAEGAPPSRRLAQLKRLIEYLDSRDNVFVRMARSSFSGRPTWRRAWKNGAAARDRRCADGWRRWRNRGARSLASHAFEHPQDPFPEFTEESPLLEAVEIGHPLIPESKLVRNSVSLGGDLRLLVVSGSNMSGKSTLLRTLGVNVCWRRRARRCAQSGCGYRRWRWARRFVSTIRCRRHLALLCRNPAPAADLDQTAARARCCF